MVIDPFVRNVFGGNGSSILTANIVIEMGYAADLHREALIATGVVLFVFILGINMLLSVHVILANKKDV